MKTLQSTFAYFRPKFLGRIDKYLLLNYPRLWMSKIHYVIFYGILVKLFFFILPLAPIQADILSRFSNSLIWAIILSEMAVYFFWANMQAPYSIEHEFGETHNVMGFTEILVYLLATSIIFSFPLNFYSRIALSSVDSLRFWHIFFIVVGAYVIFILNHSNWRTIGLFIVYGIILFLVMVYASTLTNRILWRFGEFNLNAANVILFGMALFVLIQSLQLLNAKRYKRFAFINFITLPFVMYMPFWLVISYQIYALIPTSTFISYTEYMYILNIAYCLLWLLLTPATKKILVYVISLPKE